MTESDLAPEVLARWEELAAESRTAYRAFDQLDKLGEPPWRGQQVAEWEAAHGHDCRLKCYPEFGCQVIDSELAEATYTLLSGVRSRDARIVELEAALEEAPAILSGMLDDHLFGEEWTYAEVLGEFEKRLDTYRAGVDHE